MSDPILDVKRVAERMLSAITPSIPTAFEGVSFTPPDGMFQRVQFVISPPTDPTFDAFFHRENINFQVFVNGPLDEGTAAVISRATLIRNTFKKGTTYVEQDTHIHVLQTPQIAGTTIINNRIVCPVLIPMTAEVYV